jgi:hypothetical protein
MIVSPPHLRDRDKPAARLRSQLICDARSIRRLNASAKRAESLAKGPLLFGEPWQWT